LVSFSDECFSIITPAGGSPFQPNTGGFSIKVLAKLTWLPKNLALPKSTLLPEKRALAKLTSPLENPVWLKPT
jgi:hypothetical protein